MVVGGSAAGAAVGAEEEVTFSFKPGSRRGSAHCVGGIKRRIFAVGRLPVAGHTWPLDRSTGTTGRRRLPSNPCPPPHSLTISAWFKIAASIKSLRPHFGRCSCNTVNASSITALSKSIDSVPDARSDVFMPALLSLVVRPCFWFPPLGLRTGFCAGLVW